jgi:hypothetical protein
MNYWQLEKMINEMSVEQKDKEVQIFVYCNGNMEVCNNLCEIGDNKTIDKYCEDFQLNPTFYKKGFPYLLCGVPYLLCGVN